VARVAGCSRSAVFGVFLVRTFDNDVKPRLTTSRWRQPFERRLKGIAQDGRAELRSIAIEPSSDSS